MPTFGTDRVPSCLPLLAGRRGVIPLGIDSPEQILAASSTLLGAAFGKLPTPEATKVESTLYNYVTKEPAGRFHRIFFFLNFLL